MGRFTCISTLNPKGIVRKEILFFVNLQHPKLMWPDGLPQPCFFFFFPKKPLLSGGTDRLRTLLVKFCLREVVVCVLQKRVLNPCFCGIRLSKESCSSYGPCCCCCAFTGSLWITCGVRSSCRFSGILTPSWPGEYEISILPMRKLRFVEGK